MKDELEEVKQPKTLEECFELLNTVLVDKDVFKNTLESNAVVMSHHSLGRWIRNNWYLWWNPKLAQEYEENNYPQEKPEIVKFFNEELKIQHADDMSGIIIQSYHRHLNGRDLKVEEQVKKYLAYWAKEDNNGEEE